MACFNYIFNILYLKPVPFEPKLEASCVNTDHSITAFVGLSKVRVVAYRDSISGLAKLSVNGDYEKIRKAMRIRAFANSWNRIVALFSRFDIGLPGFDREIVETGVQIKLEFSSDTPILAQNGIKDALTSLGLAIKEKSDTSSSLIFMVNTHEEVLPLSSESGHRFVRLITNIQIIENGSVIDSQTISIKSGGITIDQASFQAIVKIKDEFIQLYGEKGESWAH